MKTIAILKCIYTTERKTAKGSRNWAAFGTQDDIVGEPHLIQEPGIELDNDDNRFVPGEVYRFMVERVTKLGDEWQPQDCRRCDAPEPCYCAPEMDV